MERTEKEMSAHIEGLGFHVCLRCSPEEVAISCLLLLKHYIIIITIHVAQASLELDAPASETQVLGFQACVTTSISVLHF